MGSRWIRTQLHLNRPLHTTSLLLNIVRLNRAADGERRPERTLRTLLDIMILKNPFDQRRKEETAVMPATRDIRLEGFRGSQQLSNRWQCIPSLENPAICQRCYDQNTNKYNIQHVYCKGPIEAPALIDISKSWMTAAPEDIC